MTADDHAAWIAEVLAEHAEERGFRDMKVHCACGWESDDNYSSPRRSVRAFDAHRIHVAEALVAARIGVLPEAEVTEEWGVRVDGQDRESTFRGVKPTGWLDKNREKHPDARLIRRTREIRHSEHVTEWEAVDE